MDFQVTLPSNVLDKGLFTRNTIGNYITKLATTLELGRNWEVGLAEISYTKSWYNINMDQELCVIDGAGDFHQKDVMLKAGHYSSYEDLMKSVNTVLQTYKGKKITDPPSFEVNEHNHKVTMIIGADDVGGRCYATMSEEIRNMLGFEETFFEELYSNSDNFRQATEPKRVKKSTKPIKAGLDAVRAYDLNAGIHSLYIYCDIIKPSFVGDSYRKLLRVVKIPQKTPFGEQCVVTFDKPHYFPLNSHRFDTIEIHVQDDTGETIRFQFGRTIAILHFRERDG